MKSVTGMINKYTKKKKKLKEKLKLATPLGKEVLEAEIALCKSFIEDLIYINQTPW